MWRFVGASVPGTSHLSQGIPCQDCHVVNCDVFGGNAVLWAVVTDGAGSAKFSEFGSQVVCNQLDGRIRRWLAAFNGNLSHLDDLTVTKWITRLRYQLLCEAIIDRVSLREYACTLAGIIASADRAICFQIGDSSIITRRELTDYQAVFWPETGEYANATYFITDDNFQQHLEVHIIEPAPYEVALFSDGIQRLALRFASKSVHAPFFTPMFDRLSQEIPGYSKPLASGLRTFLASDKVNQRTDDDKTLVLATRIPKSGDAASEESVNEGSN